MSERQVGVSGGVGSVSSETKPVEERDQLQPRELVQLAAPIYAAILAQHGGFRSVGVRAELAEQALVMARELWDALPAGEPVNVAVPYIEQRGSTLNCTMGEWENRPHGYEYRWHLDGVEVVAGEGEGGQTSVSSADYVIRASDVGRRATCVVVARNVLGEVEAPPSNEVVVVLP